MTFATAHARWLEPKGDLIDCDVCGDSFDCGYCDDEDQQLCDGCYQEILEGKDEEACDGE